MNDVELHKEVLSTIYDHYDVKFQCDCRKFDCNNFDYLVDHLKKLNIEHYGLKDKIMLVHMDTDYYDPLLEYGIIPVNVLRIFQDLDIPFHALLFVTNHFGIKKEFNNLLRNHNINDRPVVIETLLSKILISKEHKTSNQQVEVEKIEKQGLCMMNAQRSHRVLLYNFIKDQDLLDKIATSQRFV